MNENCEICNSEVEIVGIRCCNGIDCQCGGQDQKPEDKYVICPNCIEIIENMNEKGFTVFGNGGQTEIDINVIAEMQ